MCIGRGPAWEEDDHGFKSNEIIARRQSDKAQSLWEDNGSLDITGEPSLDPLLAPPVQLTLQTFLHWWSQHCFPDRSVTFCADGSAATWHALLLGDQQLQLDFADSNSGAGGCRS